MKLKGREEFKSNLEYGKYFLSHSASNLYKYLDALSGDFWNVRKLLTYGRPFNFITSERSVGKSTALAMFVLLDWIYNGHKFIYTRRDKDTIQLTAPKFFDNAVQILNERMPSLDKNFKKIVKMELKGGKYFFSDTIEYDDEDDEEGTAVSVEIGTCIPLSMEQKSKSTPFGDVYTILFDEYLERDPTRYIGNSRTMETAEYEAIMSLYESVDRRVGVPHRNEVRVFFLGNIKTKFCPIYLTMGIADYISSDSRIIAPKDKYWVMERVDGVEAVKAKEESFSYQLATEEHRKYAFSTDTDEDDTFIDKPGVAHYYETVRLEGKDYGIRIAASSVMPAMYIGKPDKTRKRIIALDHKGHTGIDYMLIKSWREYPLTKQMADLYKKGLLFFDTQYTKQVFLKYLQFID